MRALLPMCLALLAAACARPETVGRALTGDTLLLGGRPLRLAHVAAPAPGQPCRDADGGRYDCGEAARAALGRMTDFRMVSCAPLAPGPGRPRAVCETGGRDLARAMAAAGWAVPATGAPEVLHAAARAARAAGRGLWSGAFEPPAAFRARWGLSGAGGPAAGRAGDDCAIKGNISGRARIYHLPGGANYAQVVIAPEQGERWFCSEAEALAAGWRRARS
jgi:endonuclease YncB( thermonuclease family)